MSEPASPIVQKYDEDGRVSPVFLPGLTKRELACIELRIPETGDEELDALITKARRQKIAAKAMQGILAGGTGLRTILEMNLEPEYVSLAVILADALIKELEK